MIVKNVTVSGLYLVTWSPSPRTFAAPWSTCRVWTPWNGPRWPSRPRLFDVVRYRGQAPSPVSRSGHGLAKLHSRKTPVNYYAVDAIRSSNRFHRTLRRVAFLFGFFLFFLTIIVPDARRAHCATGKHELVERRERLGASLGRILLRLSAAAAIDSLQVVSVQIRCTAGRSPRGFNNNNIIEIKVKRFDFLGSIIAYFFHCFYFIPGNMRGRNSTRVL